LYGAPAKLPVDEAMPIRPNNPYAHSKFLAEQTCRFYSEYYDIPITVLRPFNVYGPGQDSRFLIPQLAHQIQHERQITVQDLEPRRDYVYVDDVAEAIALTIQRNSGFRVLNIGSGQSTSVHSLIELMQNIAGTKKEIACKQNKRRNEISDVFADASAARRELGWMATTSLEDGLRAVLRDVRA
jgi:GDP-4-dehydro-6-deoxy-D-mannose reductase